MAKKAIQKRAKTGLAGAPKDCFHKLKHYFQFEIDKKGYSNIIREYAKARFTRDEYAAIDANPEWQFTTFSHVAASCYWDSLGEEFPENYPAKSSLLPQYFAELIEAGKKILGIKKVQQGDTPVKKMSPQELLARKVNNTVMYDIDSLEDAWFNGEKAEIQIYELFRKHDLKGAAVDQVKQYVERILTEYTCDDVDEYYGHLGKVEIKRRVKVLTDMLADLESVRDASKAKRTVRKTKPKPIEKQVARVQYQKEDAELKIVSINPAQIVGSHRLIVINTKYRTVTEYVTDAINGFEISGTSIKNFDPEKSRTKKLRKPEDFIPFVKKSAKQFDKAFNDLTTKQSVPNGRLNTDTILMRVQ